MIELGPIIPRAWVTELERLRDRGLTGFIAGGAVRDIILRRPFRDVDIWFTQDQGSAVRQVGQAEGYECLVDGGYVSSGLASVWRYTIDGQEFNWIVANYTNQDDIVGRFDFGICRAAVTLKPSLGGRRPFPVECDLRAYPEFIEDMERKVFRVRRDNGSTRSFARWLRFQERYPDFTFEDLEPPVTL